MAVSLVFRVLLVLKGSEGSMGVWGFGGTEGQQMLV